MVGEGTLIEEDLLQCDIDDFFDPNVGGGGGVPPGEGAETWSNPPLSDRGIQYLLHQAAVAGRRDLILRSYVTRRQLASLLR